MLIQKLNRDKEKLSCKYITFKSFNLYAAGDENFFSLVFETILNLYIFYKHRTQEVTTFMKHFCVGLKTKYYLINIRDLNALREINHTYV